MGNHEVKPKEATKLLGVVFDQELKWKPHVQRTIYRATKTCLSLLPPPAKTDAVTVPGECRPSDRLRIVCMALFQRLQVAGLSVLFKVQRLATRVVINQAEVKQSSVTIQPLLD
jgi:hypothetical protein